MPQARYAPAALYDIETWDGTLESLAALCEFSGQHLSVNADGSVTVLLGSGEIQVLRNGWCLYRTDGIELGALSPGFVAWLQDPPEAG